MAGSAVLTMVESRVCMKKPVATSHSITVSERAVGWGAVGAGVVAAFGGFDMEGGCSRAPDGLWSAHFREICAGVQRGLQLGRALLSSALRPAQGSSRAAASKKACARGSLVYAALMRIHGLTSAFGRK